MKKRWVVVGVAVICSVLLGFWMGRRGESKCQTCFRGEPPFFQLFSSPTTDLGARGKKFLSFTRQSYPFFRVAVTPEEAAFPDVKVIMDKFPEKFVKLPNGYQSQELFYRWIHSIPASDIIVLSPPDEALESSALDGLKNLYKGSAAWLSFQGDVKKWAENGVLSGYASLFQKIKLEDFLEKGVFSEKKSAENRLFELAGRHVRRLRGNFIEGKKYGYSWVSRSRHPYPRYRPLLEEGKKLNCDLVVFSFDRPLQLFALLESIQQFVTSLDQISVIYRVSSSDFEQGYNLVKEQFPHVQYLKQGDLPEQDFKPLVLKATFESPSSYVMFAVDDQIVRDTIDVKEGIQQMEKTGAIGVYYRLGRHVDFSYMLNKFQSIPPSVHIEDNVWGWQFSGGEGDWRYPHSVDMTLYRKQDIKKLLTALNYIHPNSMESKWALKAKMGGVGIYYDTSKVVNIPLNLVNPSDNRHTDQHSTEELLSMFLKGLKIDIKPLQGYENRSAHLDISVTFVPREDVVR